MKNKVIYIAYFCEGNLGEVEGVFDDKGKLMDAWCCNDASWRGEYMNGFMEKLGITVKDGEFPAKWKKKAVADLHKFFGISPEESEE